MHKLNFSWYEFEVLVLLYIQLRSGGIKQPRQESQLYIYGVEKKLALPIKKVHNNSKGPPFLFNKKHFLSLQYVLHSFEQIEQLALALFDKFLPAYTGSFSISTVGS